MADQPHEPAADDELDADEIEDAQHDEAQDPEDEPHRGDVPPDEGDAHDPGVT